ncbi:hypothetical protein [Streptomyces sp. NBC_01092]|uniref:hypothetical protein n=1 Tax=Streptomyces sp. NBC_01092 TaxID=2903748 RepID=UPI003864A37B|nr:hypothetical protein OG254_00895 [Streptomyces sp. NBC_01092]
MTATDHWAWPLWSYSQADSRYLTADSFVVAMEAVTVFAGATGQLCALVLFRAGRRRIAAMIAVLVGVTQIYRDVLYFATAALDGFAAIDLANPINLWLKFVLLNAM